MYRYNEDSDDKVGFRSQKAKKKKWHDKTNLGGDRLGTD